MRAHENVPYVGGGGGEEAFESVLWSGIEWTKKSSVLERDPPQHFASSANKKSRAKNGENVFSSSCSLASITAGGAAVRITNGKYLFP